MRIQHILLASIVYLIAMPAQALELQLQNEERLRMDEIAVALIPQDASAITSPKAQSPKEIAQKEYQFRPRITVVQKGETVAFPNKDSSHHNVYSFSEAKRFDFRLFKGKGETVTLDKTGIITIGCNIHDWMLAYIVVFDTPYYTLSDEDGIANFNDVPPGSYEVMFWHPGLSPEQGPISGGKVNITNTSTTIPTIKIPSGEEHLWPAQPFEIEEEY